jgi:farnesyl-diphosphate farnesyltransferase
VRFDQDSREQGFATQDGVRSFTQEAGADLYELLARTSRTFAITIPLLPEPARTTLCVSYLLFRIADTLEDAPAWSRVERQSALEQWCELLEAGDRQRAATLCRGWASRVVTTQAGYHELLLAAPNVLDGAGRLAENARRAVLVHAVRSARGMSAILERADDTGAVQLESIEQLRAYCYVVAGIVGELITEIFVQDAPSLAQVQRALVQHELAFGEALQLVNILKDELRDRAEGRVYLPPGARAEVLALARADLGGARSYIEALERGAAPPGFVAFTSLAADLAAATLELLERDGAGAKVPRAQVMQLHARHKAASERAEASHSASDQSGK